MELSHFALSPVTSVYELRVVIRLDSHPVNTSNPNQDRVLRYAGDRQWIADPQPPSSQRDGHALSQN